MRNSFRAIEAAVVGAVIGACLLGVVGGWGQQMAIGAVAGSVLGAIIGFFAYHGRIHRITVGAILYALLACSIAPAVDDYEGFAALPAACVGAFIGWLGWRFLLVVPIGFVGALIAASLPPPGSAPPASGGWGLVGFALGGSFAICVGTKFERGALLSKPESGPTE